MTKLKMLIAALFVTVVGTSIAMNQEILEQKSQTVKQLLGSYELLLKYQKEDTITIMEKEEYERLLQKAKNTIDSNSVHVIFLPQGDWLTLGKYIRSDVRKEKELSDEELYVIAADGNKYIQDRFAFDRFRWALETEATENVQKKIENIKTKVKEMEKQFFISSKL